MINQRKISAFVPAARKLIQARFPSLLSYVVLTAVVIATFLLQNHIVGWEPGYDELQPKHHGWVSSQGLAIISRATLENKFVGYAEAYKDEAGNPVYDYFDRYPVFFSAIFHQVLEIRPKVTSKVTIAKQVMNFIFLSTLIVAFLILDKLIKNKPLSLAAVLFTFSNPFLLFYKDMVHFDQPALFGFLLLTYAITVYKLDGLKWPLYPAVLIAVGAGRGYASFAVLGLWLALEAVFLLRAQSGKFWAKLVQIIRLPAFGLLALGILWGGALLSYNILVEAQKRSIPIRETSILDSASRRLSLNEEFNTKYAQIIDWPGFTAGEISRIVQWSFPINRVSLGLVGNSLVLLAMAALIGKTIRQQPAEKRVIYLLLSCAGFLWIFPMRSLAAFHDYTTMYFIGIPLAFFSALLLSLKPSKDAAYYLAIMGLVVYLFSLSQLSQWHEDIAGNANDYAYDYARIVENIAGQGNNIYIADEAPYGKYASGFYFSEQFTSPLDQADYVVSSDEAFLPNNLTPNNRYMFLFKK